MAWKLVSILRDVGTIPVGYRSSREPLRTYTHLYWVVRGSVNLGRLSHELVAERLWLNDDGDIFWVA